MKFPLSRLFSLATVLPGEKNAPETSLPFATAKEKGEGSPSLVLRHKLKWLFVSGGKRTCDFPPQEPALRIQSSYPLAILLMFISCGFREARIRNE